jgi:hypothetical protein
MRATLSCAESEAMDAASYTIKEQLLSEALVLLDKRELRICVLYRRDPYPRILQHNLKSLADDLKINSKTPTANPDCRPSVAASRHFYSVCVCRPSGPFRKPPDLREKRNSVNVHP